MDLDLTNYTDAALFEHRFWLQVLGDHARFILNALSPKETMTIQKANYFINVFDQLLLEVNKPLTEEQLNVLTQQAYHYAQEIRLFKLEIIKRQLTKDIVIELPPTFINHMVNEVEEYLLVLCFLLAKQIPTTNPVYQHLVWLLDAGGHAAAIDAALDDVEKKLKEKSREFNTTFEQFYIKAVEMAGFMRSGLTQFPALSRFNLDVACVIEIFKDFIRELECLEKENKVLGTLTPLLLDHMAREECYYLIKLAQVSEVKMPSCDPTKPRSDE